MKDISKDKTIIICAPLTGNVKEVKENIERASQVAFYFWKKGNFVLCPHLNSGRFFGLLDEEIVKNGYKTLIRELAPSKKAILVVLPNYIGSKGCGEEIVIALRAHMEIRFLSSESLEEIEKIEKGDREWITSQNF